MGTLIFIMPVLQSCLQWHGFDSLLQGTLEISVHTSCEVFCVATVDGPTKHEDDVKKKAPEHTR
jgi:hypothetical protein